MAAAVLFPTRLPANIPRVLVYRIGGEAKLPDLPVTKPASLEPPAVIGDEATWTAGKAVYHTHCGVCHGDSAVSGGVIPDLRLSPITAGRDPTRSSQRLSPGRPSMLTPDHSCPATQL